MELLTVGLINDMFSEQVNDEYPYKVVATQEDYDRFQVGNDIFKLYNVIILLKQEGENMVIFLGEADAYKNNIKCAYLNWFFDDGLRNKGKDLEFAEGSLHLGKAYIGNAISTLAILMNNQENFLADKMIFPALFDTWHGIELLLKSSLVSIKIICNDNNGVQMNHDIKNYYKKLDEKLDEIDFSNLKPKILKTLKELIDEFDRVGANFDFARYPFDRNLNPQFYNASLSHSNQWQTSLNNLNRSQDAIPNIRVNLFELLETLFFIFDEFIEFVEYLISSINVKEKISESNYENFCKAGKEFNDGQYNINSIDELLELLYDKVV